jgi:hypothetical protein
LRKLVESSSEVKAMFWERAMDVKSRPLWGRLVGSLVGVDEGVFEVWEEWEEWGWD